MAITNIEAESISIAEQAVIGSILLDGDLFPQVETIITPESFASQNLSKIFSVCKILYLAGQGVNLLSVTEALGRNGDLASLGGPAKLADLCDNVGSSSQALFYAEKINQAATSRQYARMCQVMTLEAQKAAQGKGSFPDILSKHLGELDKISHYARDNCNKIDWLNAKPDNVYEIIWPLGIHEYVNIFPKNVAVIGGASNSGKTAFMLNVAYDNRMKHHIKYFSSEMGPEELRLRIQLFGYPLKDWCPIEFIDRSGNFGPVIDPDALNIIDYLEITDNFYQIGGEIKTIFDRLRSGIAVIAVQKKSNTDYARGGEFTLEKARLYLSMDYGSCKIVKGKNWAQQGFNPNGQVFNYKIVHGCRFMVGEQG